MNAPAIVLFTFLMIIKAETKVENKLYQKKFQSFIHVLIIIALFELSAG